MNATPNRQSITLRAAVLPLAVASLVCLAAHAAAPKAAPLPASGAFFTHTATQGDTLIKLADRYLEKRTNWQPLQKLNNIADPTRIKPGTQIRIPIPEMRRELAEMKVLAAQGDVQVDGAKLATGGAVKEGQKLATGDNGFVTLQLADGSTLTVQSKSKVNVDNARKLANTGGVLDTVFKVVSGRVEAGVERQRGPAARFEVKTDTSTMGVRGTKFRVAADEAGKVTKSEVLTGKIGVTAEGVAGAELGLNAGFGTLVEAGKPPLPPVALLPEPGLSTVPARFERPRFSFKVEPVAGATAYRAQVAKDAGFKDVQADVLSNSNEIRIGGVDDGELFLRVRAVDKLGLEGKDAQRGFTLAARPEPPITSLPAGNAKVADAAVKFEWAAPADAGSYRLQVARAADTAFASPVIDEAKVGANRFQAAKPLPPGDYAWRVAAVTALGKPGPWGDAQKFSVRSALADPDVPQLLGGKVRFSWRGDAGVRYQFQLATDSYFRRIVTDLVTDKPEVIIDRPAVGVYHMRYRAVEGDAGAGPFSTSQSIDIYPLGR
ncbi:MAG: FecR domain-containing protein [Betaproteobacteria bacterium]|nr:FecR domain-containing protein [Betaproteobacteria bacterium]